MINIIELGESEVQTQTAGAGMRIPPNLPTAIGLYNEGSIPPGELPKDKTTFENPEPKPRNIVPMYSPRKTDLNEIESTYPLTAIKDAALSVLFSKPVAVTILFGLPVAQRMGWIHL